MAAADVGAPVTRCVFTDDRLDEVSGLVWTPAGPWVVDDSGNPSTVYRLGPDCEVTGSRAVAVDGRDVEDLARAADGTFWLSDTGDNARTRASVAVLRLPPTGGEVVTRLVYPDGPHDVEAMLLPADGRPVFVTKDLGGRSGVYLPDTPLPPATAAPSSDPVALRRAGEVVLPASDTPSPGVGALGLLGGGLVTGGAVSPDGRVAVLRTYTDAWLYTVPIGTSPDTADAVVAALTGSPARIPLPGEPQGEAVAVSPDGALLSAGESPVGQGPGALRAVPGALAAPAAARPPAAGAAAAPAAAPAADAEPASPLLASDRPSGPSPTVTAVAAAVALVVALAGAVGAVWWRRRTRAGSRRR